MMPDRSSVLLRSADALVRGLGVDPIGIASRAPEGCVAGDALLGEGLAAALATYGARWPGGDPRAVGSDWTKAYFRTVLPPLLAPVFAGVVITAAPSDLWVRTEGGEPVAVHLRTGAAVRGEQRDPADLAPFYGALLGRHAARVVAAVREASGLSPRVAWSNLGGLLAFAYRTLAGRPELAGAAARHAEAVLGRPEVPWFDGRNPLLDPVRTIPVGIPGLPEVAHVRRVCCLRDRLGQTLCLSCPRLDLDGRVALYRDFLAQRAREA
ncbi:MAG TPA: siderophore-iron reductase FhuF [Arenibaculum sp.]|jgi:ferric iron reductase protein FhuF|nr:siderophore-iron reductase FhuF [Arenibaculum sp.]